MSIPILIYGDSGTGKSTSIRTLDPFCTAIVNVLGKPLPFNSKDYMPQQGKAPRIFVSDDYKKIKDYMSKVNNSSITTLIIDDFQYLMANEFMRRVSEKGYNKFSELAFNVWDLIKFSLSLRSDLKIYFLSHADTSADGLIKAKTIGKLLDEKICLEGMFTIILYSIVSDGKYKFLTKNNGHIIAKCPIDLFDSDFIDNDLKFINDRIDAFYNFSDPHPWPEVKEALDACPEFYNEITGEIKHV